MIKIKELKTFVDDRGVLIQAFNDDLPFAVKRCYIIRGTRDVIRAFHGHALESKAFVVLDGLVMFAITKMRAKKLKGGGEARILKFHLTGRGPPDILIIPPGNYNGFKALEDCTIVVFSSLTVKESLKDDYRLPYDHFGKIWEVQHR